MKLQPTILVTGGGTLNLFMIHRMKTLMPESEFIIPDRKIIEYKKLLSLPWLGSEENSCYLIYFADVTELPSIRSMVLITQDSSNEQSIRYGGHRICWLLYCKPIYNLQVIL